MRSVLADAFRNLSGWDSALGRTLAGLLRDPGKLASEFVAGRRRAFVNPARFCLLSLALWLLSARVLEIDLMDVLNIQVTDDSSGGQGKIADQIRAFMGRNLDVLLYLSLPLQALLLRLFFRRSDRNVAECLVLVLYLAGLGYLIGTAMIPASLAAGKLMLRVRAPIIVLWTVYAAHGFFGRPWFATIWRVLLVAFLHMIGTLLLFGAIAIPWAIWHAE